MHRLHCPSQNISAEIVIISDKNQIHHIRDVLRLKPEEEVAVFDDKGNEYLAAIEKFLPDSITLGIKKKHKAIARRMQITVACAIPKKSKMDDIVDKLTQLGVDKIIPLLTQRVVVKWEEKQKIAHQKRWEKVALSAAKQSQRNTLPVIEPVTQIKKVLSYSADYDLKLIPALIGRRRPLKEALRPQPKNILILIGPEGDFTPQEVESAVKTGFIPISLGDLVLRVETAAVAVVSFIKLDANH